MSQNARSPYLADVLVWVTAEPEGNHKIGPSAACGLGEPVFYSEHVDFFLDARLSVNVYVSPRLFLGGLITVIVKCAQIESDLFGIPTLAFANLTHVFVRGRRLSAKWKDGVWDQDTWSIKHQPGTRIVKLNC